MPDGTVSLYRFSSLGNVKHAISTRDGGVSRAPYATLNLGFGTEDDEKSVSTNQAILLSHLEVDPASLLRGLLTHGNRVSVFHHNPAHKSPAIRYPVRHGSQNSEYFFPSDGVVSDVPGMYFLLTFADCVPLLFHDPVCNVIGAAHAGWRGTAARIGPVVMRTMQQEFGCLASNIRVGIGPSIGPCCYSVGPEVIAAFQSLNGDPRIVDGPRTYHLDLWDTNELQLRASGATSVERADMCTACNTNAYFSHRAEAGVTGRFAMIAGLSEDRVEC